jgi:hypothetical protein
MQQRHQCFETRIDRSRAVGFGAHWRSPGRRRIRRAAASAVAAGSTTDRQSASHRDRRLS